MTTKAILKPYERRREPGRFQRIVLGLALAALAAFYGLLSIVLPLQMLIFPLVPILIGLLLILWLLPDIGGVQEAWLGSALHWYVLFNALWPTYVAINMPGLPWISGTRIALVALISVAAVNYATSSDMRERISTAMGTIPIIQKSFWIFWATTLVAIPFSADIAQSLNKFANNQIYWTAMFVLACWLSIRAGFVKRLSVIIVWTIIIVSLLAINEYRVNSVIWLRYLPSWLIADYDVFEVVSRFNGRLGSGEYRARGVFAGSLYFAEYLAVAMPFVLHHLARSRKLTEAVLLSLATLAVVSAMIFTGSRSAALAMLTTPFLYGLMWAWRTRRQQPNSLVATSVLFAYPILLVLLSSLVLFWRRLYVMVIGGGQASYSTEARNTQWHMGWPKILSRPLGHGGGTSGNVLGFYNPGRTEPTVDSYFLTLFLDYGFIGFAAFFCMMGAAIWFSFQAYNRARDEDMLVLAPVTIALFNFTIIKSVSSTEGSMPIIFILIGCVVGLTARQQRLGMVPGVKVAPRHDDDMDMLRAAAPKP